MNDEKRTQNEKKFENWNDLGNGHRKYWYDVQGRSGWKAKYIKIVDHDENTLRFYQEIYDNVGILVEIHEKYPIDKGHQTIKGGMDKNDNS